MQEILRDETNYKLTDTNIDNDIASEITKFCKINNEKLTKKQEDFRTKYISKTNHFNRLTKIDKLGEIKIAVKTQKSEYLQIPNPIDLKF